MSDSPDHVPREIVQGLQVPVLGFGTWQLAGQECREAVRQALELGYRHIDTARAYENERQVGEGLRDSGVPREDVFLVTKVWRDDLSPEGMQWQVHDGLRDLGVDYVDLLLIHWPADDFDMLKAVETLDQFRQQGKTRAIGVSNFPPSLFQQALQVAPLLCNQVEYHPFLGQERLLEIARAHDALITAYSPIARGLVGEDPVLREIGLRYGKTPAQVALRWLVEQEAVVAIPRSRRHEHIAANLQIFDFSLSPEDQGRIAALPKNRRLVDPGWISDWNA